MSEYKRIWMEFNEERSDDLLGKYVGAYRAQIIETNDPLRMHRVQFLCPELHNSDSKFGEWASPSFNLGGQGAGNWTSPCIGDQIWVSFEKGHPYGPVWMGAADATMRKFYPKPSIFGKTPVPVNEDGDPEQEAPKDFLEDYVPKDERPMSTGIQDRYGSLLIMSSVGYFPPEHDIDPLPTGVDAIAESEFKSSNKRPIANDPDLKMIAAITKYGTMTLMSDVGYDWQSEFNGVFETDYDFEVARNKYFTKLMAGNSPRGYDHRGWFASTMLGHKIEMRDTGWNDSRAHEFDDIENEYEYKSVKLSNTDKDERWLKLRSKGGHFDEFIDIGFDPKEDVFTNRFLISEVGPLLDVQGNYISSLEEENKLGTDVRMMRRQTRWGIKFIMDDRGSDTTHATGKEIPYGQGAFLKGRRDDRGFFIGFNEQDSLNSFMATSPTGSTMEINDKYQYVGLSSTAPLTDSAPSFGLEREPLSARRDGHYGVEWFNNSLRGLGFEYNSNHLKLDRYNRYVRLKTAELQGVEFRDRNGPGAAWAEFRDVDDRGMWINSDGGYAVWRSLDGSQVILLDDGKNITVIKDSKGTIQISAEKNVEISTQAEVVINAERKITLSAKDEIVLAVGGTQFVVKTGVAGTNELLSGRTLAGRHVEIEIPAHPKEPATEAPVQGTPTGASRVDLPSLAPGVEGTDRALDQNDS